MTSRLPMLAALALLSGCTSYDCADVRFLDMASGEWCGPLGGSFGMHHVDDGIVHLLFTPEGPSDSPEWDDALDWLPSYGLMFRGEHLEEGATLGDGELIGYCSRIHSDSGNPYDGTYTTWWQEGSALTVVRKDGYGPLGGPAWVFDWDVQCPADAQMSSTGKDSLEFIVTTDEFDFELYGFPPDYEFVDP